VSCIADDDDDDVVVVVSAVVFWAMNRVAWSLASSSGL
jgi:hypothetical protein